MKFKPIVADPLVMYQAGMRTLSQVVILIHLGRCGLHGATVRSITEAMAHMPEGSVYTILEKLLEMGWITRYCRQNSQGRAGRYVITVKGWEIITKVPDLSMFPGADGKPVVNEVAS
jgi:DNA-binding MarR family transcriptional regulator